MFNQFFTIRAQLKSSFGIFKEKPSKKQPKKKSDKAQEEKEKTAKEVSLPTEKVEPETVSTLETNMTKHLTKIIKLKDG